MGEYHRHATVVLTAALAAVLCGYYDVLSQGMPVYRNPGVSDGPDGTLHKRVDLWHELTWDQVNDPGLVGHVAVEDCDRIGELVGISWPDGVRYPYLVIDCRERHLGPWGFAVEVEKEEWFDHYDWAQWASRVPVTLWQGRSSPPCQGPK